MNSELLITLAILFSEFVLFAICYIRSRRPPDPLKPRLFPYVPAMIFIVLAMFVTTAHTIGVITGHRIEAKNRMKGQ